MSAPIYLMNGDLGDLAYAIAVLIMAAASGIVGHVKKKKKQEQLRKEIHPSGRAEPAKKERKEVKTLEDLVEVFLPPEVRELRRRKEREEAAKRAAPQAPRRAEPLPPRVESPWRRPQPVGPRRAPARPAPARPVRPRPPMPETLVAPPIAEIRHVAHELARAKAEEAKAALRARVRRAPGVKLPRRLARDDLRKAIVLNEVLGKPVGFRDPAEF